MRELPRGTIEEGFYLWFNFEEKEEYYATPLYLYNVNRKRIDKNIETRLCLELEKDISKTKLNKKKEIARHPATIYIHYVENLGAMLINFLNADFTNYETAYNTFFYAYGFELIKEDEHYLESREPLTDIEFLKILEDTYSEHLEDLLEIQSEFKKCVDFERFGTL